MKREELPVDRMAHNFFAGVFAVIGGIIVHTGIEAVAMRGDWFAGISWTMLGALITLLSLGYIVYDFVRDVEWRSIRRRMRENAQMRRNRWQRIGRKEKD